MFSFFKFLKLAVTIITVVLAILLDVKKTLETHVNGRYAV
jgi:hypothetical protein